MPRSCTGWNALANRHSRAWKLLDRLGNPADGQRSMILGGTVEQLMKEGHVRS